MIQNFSQSKHKKIPDTKKLKKILQKKKDKKKDKKERHDDKTSTNHHLQNTTGEVIFGNLTPLAKSIKH